MSTGSSSARRYVRLGVFTPRFSHTEKTGGRVLGCASPHAAQGSITQVLPEGALQAGPSASQGRARVAGASREQAPLRREARQGLPCQNPGLPRVPMGPWGLGTVHAVASGCHTWGRGLEEEGGQDATGSAVKEAWCLCLSGIRRLRVPAGHAEVPRADRGPGVRARPPQSTGRNRHDHR